METGHIVNIYVFLWITRKLSNIIKKEPNQTGNREILSYLEWKLSKCFLIWSKQNLIELIYSFAVYSDCDSYNFNLSSPPKKSSRVFNRQVYQSSKSDSVNSTKSTLEYSSTTKHPTGAYQDIEYKVCHSLDSDSQTTSSYR